MSDAVVGALAERAGLLVRAAVTTGLSEEARLRHGASPTAAAALGRALTGALLLGSLLKNEETILLQWRGDGPLGPLVAEGRADLRVRGYAANPTIDLPSRSGKLDVGRAVGRAGSLVVVKDLRLKEPYTSTVPLQTGEIGDDLAHYLLASEQTASAVGLGVHVNAACGVDAAGGLLIEALPGARDDDVDRAVENLAALGAISQRVLEGATAGDLAARVLAGLPHRLKPLGAPSFSCSCGPERLATALAALSAEEASQLLAQRGEIVVRCAFCATRWRRTALDGPWEKLSPLT